MVLPLITSIPRCLRHGAPVLRIAYGIGCTTEVTRVVIPYTRIGIMGGVMLGLGRALGETIAVTFAQQRITGPAVCAGNDDLRDHRQRIHRSGRRPHTSLVALGLICSSSPSYPAIARYMLMRIDARAGLTDVDSYIASPEPQA